MTRNNGVYMLKAKTALRLTVDDYDAEILDLVQAAQEDLGIAGVVIPEQYTAIVTRAIVTYCRLHFPTLSDGEFDRMKKSYDEQKAQLATATGFTDWGRSQ